MESIYAVQPGDVYWAGSDVGWVVGHSYIVYAPLLTGCTTILFEGKPVRPGSATVPVPGYDVQVLDPTGKKVGPNEEGTIAVKLPLPPGCLPTLWNDDERFQSSYMERYPGYYLTGDGGYKDPDDYVYIMGRIDDVINVAGHRLSTGEMEELIASHTAVAECSVIGVEDELRGQVPIGMVVLKDGANIDPKMLEKELIEIVRKEIGAFAYFRQAAIVKRLPKTRSGKILRNVMRKIADGQPFQVPSTIDDPVILDEIKQTMSSHRMGKAFKE
jgi:acyl-coenzyme A synthetase/AMP-(fatty) acid ligase